MKGIKNMINDDFRKILNFQTVASKPIDPSIIKIREQGSQKFKYISGEATNQILLEATLFIGYEFQVDVKISLEQNIRIIKEFLFSIKMENKYMILKLLLLK